MFCKSFRWARQKAYSSVNFVMVEAYWNIGKRIVEEEQKGAKKAIYGDTTLKNLSKVLTADFGKGFSYANLRNFRQFYETYPDYSNCYAVRSNLSWSHHRIIMRVENPNARAYYLKECAEQNWSTRTLERNLSTFYYERLLSTKNTQEALVNTQELESSNAIDFIKAPMFSSF